MHLLPVWLNLDACSTIRLAAVALALATAAYLTSRKGKSRATLFLGLVFWGVVVFELASFLEFSGSWYWQPRNLKNLLVPLLQDAGPSLAVVSLVLFTYHFPRLPRRQRGEYRAVVAAVCLVSALTLGLAVYNFVFLERRQSRFDFTMSYYMLLYASIGARILLAVALLLRRSVQLSAGKSRPWWRRLLRPRGRHAATARALALNLLLPAAAVSGYVLMTYGVLSLPVATYLVWLFFLLFHFVFLVTYLNRASEGSTFQVKLTGLTLIPVFALLGLMAMLVGRHTETDFSTAGLVPSQRSLRFTPNAAGSYDVAAVPHRLDPERGRRLEVSHGGGVTVGLAFDFPFYGRSYRGIRVLHGPLVLLGEEPSEEGWGGYDPNPAIAPVIMNLDPSRGAGIFVKSEPGALTVTWFALPELSYANEVTVQLRLQADGAVLMRFGTVQPRGRYASVQMYNFTTASTTGRHPGSRGKAVAFGAKLTGLHPGGSAAPLRPVSFSGGLPYSSPRPEAIFESYEAAYAAYLHDRMAPPALILLASGLLIVFLFPVLFQANLIRPLAALAEGMRRAVEGDPEVQVQPRFRDEIGFLTRCFNRTLQSIRAHEASFRTAAENLQEGILILREGRPIYANRRMAEICGCSASAPAGELGGEPGAELGSEVLAALRGGSPPGAEGGPEETLLRTRAGTGVPVELSRAPTVWEGLPAELVVVRDISRRRGAEERARDRDQRLMQANKLISLGVLLETMAHQLTAPSRAILDETAVLGKAGPALAALLAELGPERQELLVAGRELREFRAELPGTIEAIRRNARRLEAIVAELQSFGREDPFPVMRVVDLRAVLESAVELASGYLRRATERFSLEIAPELPPVRGNPQLLEQVVVNLLLNACQALPEPSRGITLRCGRAPDESGAGREAGPGAGREAGPGAGRAVIIEVRDQGVGIAPEHLERLGERFFTTRRAAGGTGLGLHVARSILERHGGTLELRSERGRGTIAVVSLPVSEDEERREGR